MPPFNGAGAFSVYTPGNPVVTGTVISSTVNNNTNSDFATGLSSCLLKDGTQTVTANIPMAGFKFTGLGAGSAAGNSLRYEQLFSASLVTLLGALTVPGVITPSAGVKGTATNDSATAGNVGEYIESVVAATNFPATGVFGDLTSISLTAGDWDVSALGFATVNGATMTGGVTIGISVTSGNATTGLVAGSSRMDFQPPTSTASSSGTVAAYRMSLSGTTTIYFKFSTNYSAGGPPQAAGRLSARRVR